MTVLKLSDKMRVIDMHSEPEPECQLFLFIIGGELHSASEGVENARYEEAYLMTRTNNLGVISVLGPSYDACWDVASMFDLEKL